MLNRACAEFFGTGMMVFLGCYSIKLGYSNLIISATFGIAVFLAILLLRNTSGAHINPAVSIAFYRSKHLEKQALLIYIIAQILGGLCGAIFVGKYGFTEFKVNIGYGIITEIFITFILMSSIYLIISITDKTSIVSIWVGSVVGILALIFGRYTGASLNPARTFGPNVISNELSHIPTFFISTIIGALLAAELYNLIKNKVKN